MHDDVQTHAHRILIVEDDPHISEGLKLNLVLQGYEVEVESSGTAAIQKWKVWRPDLIVLDIMLPGMDGLSVLQNIRLADEKLPVLILSARTATEDRVAGLALGVDDYMTKPFDLDEFLLRVHRMLTRMDWYREKERKHPEMGMAEADIYRFGSNWINFATSSAQGAAGAVQLTMHELRLLKVFVQNPRKPLRREHLLEVVWGYSKDITTRTVDNFIVRFRKYFESDPKHPRYFKSLRSVGYVFDPDPSNPEGTVSMLKRLMSRRS
ncbi:response regulator transcription factor [Desulfatirhabdium butyrativorans]|uniref:response regulator transcription factor n=1 Tax=Desulfatirhabdium butyrativorans TaxID=340467 RepID=UPI000429E9EA|nr:response regulator transcription factor [Desulfatirhabdium butyrativorans]